MCMVFYEVIAQILSHLVHMISLQNGNYQVYGHLKGKHQSSEKLYNSSPRTNLLVGPDTSHNPRKDQKCMPQCHTGTPEKNFGVNNWGHGSNE